MPANPRLRKLRCGRIKGIEGRTLVVIRPLVAAIAALLPAVGFCSASERLRERQPAVDLFVVHSGRLLRLRLGQPKAISVVRMPMRLPSMPSSAVSLDGRYVAVTLGSTTDEGSGQILYIYDYRLRNWTIVDFMRCTSPAFSNDGRFLSFVRTDAGPGSGWTWTLCVYRVGGNDPPTVVSKAVDRSQWAPSGDTLVFDMPRDDGFKAYDASTGTVRSLPKGDIPRVAGRAFAESIKWHPGLWVGSHGSAVSLSPNGLSGIFGIVSGGDEPMSTEGDMTPSGTYWSSPAVYQCFTRGSRFLWKPHSDFDRSCVEVMGWSANGRYALLSCEDGIGVMDIERRQTVYAKMETMGNHWLIGAAVFPSPSAQTGAANAK
jgi:hypothetical protein